MSLSFLELTVVNVAFIIKIESILHRINGIDCWGDYWAAKNIKIFILEVALFDKVIVSDLPAEALNLALFIDLADVEHPWKCVIVSLVDVD